MMVLPSSYPHSHGISFFVILREEYTVTYIEYWEILENQNDDTKITMLD